MALIAPRHGRFMVAFGFGGAAAGAAWASGMLPIYCLLGGANVFFLLYLALMVQLIRASGPAELRLHAALTDEGVALILFLAGLAVVVSVTSIFLVLNADDSGLQARVLALISLPLGWAMVQILAAFHYAHIYYRGATGGMVFPGTEMPSAQDFIYASFTIGMTAQVSDVVVDNQAMRQAVLLHGVASFFYNTCILAVAVNAAVTAGS
ncbi:MAG: hypothetical protein B7Z10_04185 [Rhodobacterales bacterium 32-66-7]|nr:MAG: hypothetical protein B7Z10_04185 [Rhodobacterales bacterium 32-66-7]